MKKELKDILDKVQKPGRYIGQETNSVRKEFSKGRVSVALAYPDTYEIGMSYLGLRILYHLLNEQDDMLCERVFMPMDDMERELRSNGVKLFSLETKTDICKFDIVGFSLSYELTYTNVLSMLDMGGISLLSEERSEEEPLVIAGGSCCYNPEPMNIFFDAFIIGDAEEILPEFIREYRRLKDKGLLRRERLLSLSAMPGVYVPSLYRDEYCEGEFTRLVPLNEDVPGVIEKAVVKDLENAYYPEKQIVPFVKIVHDRNVVEIMRGCPNRCRFCQASAINRPVRLRSADKVREICQRAYRLTGNERIALLSLSSVNYPQLADLVKGLNDDLKGKGVGITIPSLKIDESFYDLPEVIASIRKAGLTFAPETAKDSTREAIGKNVDIQVLCRSAQIAFRHGWRRLKLYFMIGFSGDESEEARNIVEMARELSKMKKSISGGAAEIKVSVNPFIPKPHTPFQWLGMKSMDALYGIKNILSSSSTKKVQFEVHNLEQALLEAALSRGDRRTAGVVHEAWKRGARMDGWNEFFDLKTWEEAFTSRGLDIKSYAYKKFPTEGNLPWGHIRTGVDDAFLKQELMESGLYDM